MTAPGAPGAYAQQKAAGSQPVRPLPEPRYGEAQAFREQQQAAPMANSAASAAPQAPYPSDMARMIERSAAPQAPVGQPVPEEPLPGLFDQGDPSIPMTAGAPMGPGPNSIPGLPGANPDPATLQQALEPFYAADTTGTLAALANNLAERGLW